MKKRYYLLSFILLLLAFQSEAQRIIEIEIDGQINVVTTGFISQSIEKAESEGVDALIIRLNTPGGLLSSTREIVTKILNAEVPIIVFVAPDGAHAGSAGVFITLAGHIAAMSPGTNIGAAHPVGILSSPDSIMNEKIVNDATSFMRTITEKHNRNTEWAAQAVTDSKSITAKEALEMGVIDIIANNNKDLLAQINGRTISLNSGDIVLNTQGVTIERFEMGSIDKMLNVINDPNIMYILFLLGILGIVLEFFNPGAILPGVVGVISTVLAFYAMSSLPVNYAGVILIIFAVILFVLEIKIVSHGLLSIGGIISLLIGSLMLIRQNHSFDMVYISNWVIYTSVVLLSILFIIIVYMAVRAHERKVEGGSEGIIDKTGKTISHLNPEGKVMVVGEIWNAISESGEIKKGENVVVTAIDGLKLTVRSEN